MNLFNKLHYAVKRIRSSKKIGTFAILIISAAMVMMYSSFILFEGLDYGENAVKNSLNVPIDSCGIVKFQDNMDASEAINFIDKIYALDEIKAAGNYTGLGYRGLTTEGDTDYWNQILEIQHSGKMEFDGGDDSAVQAVAMNSELLDMEKIDLIEGEKSSENEEGRYRIFLGYNFREVPVGTVFKNDYYEYEVTGVMKKGSYVTVPELISWNLGGLRMSYKLYMDNMILVLIPEEMRALSVNNLFCVNDGYTYEDAVSAIKEVGKENGIEVNTGTLRARMDTVFADNKRIKSRIDFIALIICISVFMICVTIQLLNIYMKRNELGIWLANGMSRREVLEIIWLENFIKIAVGMVIAVTIERIMLWLIFLNNNSVFREISGMMYGKPLLELVVFAFLLICIISVIPIMVISKRSTTELVKGVWN